MEQPQITNPNMPWVAVYEYDRGNGSSYIKVEHQVSIPVPHGTEIPLKDEFPDPRPGVIIVRPDTKFAHVRFSGTVDDLAEYIDELCDILDYARGAEANLT